MQIKRLFINGYKNLINTRIEFQSTDIPLAIIGNNGTGKSNLIEALLHIFIGLYYDKPPDFDFEIEYEAHNKSIKIKRIKEEYLLKIKVDEVEMSRSLFKERIREIDLMPPFPALMFCYYSGTCDRTKKLVNKYKISYHAILRNQSQNLDRLFVFSDVDQAEWCLLGLFAHRHQRLLDRLSLRDIDAFKITLRPPQTYHEEIDDPSYWGTKGAIRDFIADLDNYSRESYKPDAIGSPLKEQNLRTFLLNREELEKVGAVVERRGANLFSMMQVLATKKMLHSTKFGVVNAASEAIYSFDDLSEGEKQLLCVIGGLKLSNQSECLVLLDEPDTHLNPTWSWEYDSLLRYALQVEQQQQSMVIIATHDPVLISGLNKEQVLIARVTDGRLTYDHPVRNPRGQGVANVLTSEYFGLPSSLDKNTQNLLDERLKLAYMKDRLTDQQRERFNVIENNLKDLGLTISFRDPLYAEFEEEKYRKGDDQ